MVNLITGLIGVLLFLVFLGNYVVTLNAMPLWIIIGAVLLMVLYDYALSLRSGNQGDKQ